ncbi:MAG: hypothetical protein DRP45_00930 [Candidatus Zixiibacteriota bacterium]|nr:MAG: hypothetical protein DRP45_00930 [candidate division Zixibacteria bacterium]
MSEEELGLGEPAATETPAPATPTAGEPSDWRSGLSVEQQNSPALKDFSSVEALAGSYLNTKSMVGQDKVVKPQSDEQWSDVYNMLGRPETAGDYKYESMPEVDGPVAEALQEDQSWFSGVAHELGLSQMQADKLFSAYAGRANEVAQTQTADAEQAHARAVAAIEKEWGNAYDTNLDVAERAVKHLGGQALMDALVNTGAGNNVLILDAFMKAGKMMSEDIGIDKAGNEANTPDQLRDQVSSLQQNPAYQDGTHPDHSRIVEKMMRLNERIYGTGLAM